MNNQDLMRVLALITTCGFAVGSVAATWYVDASASGARNGTSWANAWTNLDQVSGVAAGDTVYVSGGPSGGLRNYTLSRPWTPVGGTNAKPVTYQIGQDTLHNGTAIFASDGDWLSGALHNVILSGDAGDGRQHFQLNRLKGIPINCLNSSYLRISYVNCGVQGGGFELRDVSHIEVDHCYLKKRDGYWDRVISFTSDDTGWDQNKVHDNTFYIPHDQNIPGFGDDGVQGGNDSFSFYNNTVIGYAVNPYRNHQHQDGLQPLSGNQIKVYNNYFQDIGNYAVFGDAYYGDFNHFWVYNNIIVLTAPTIQQSNPQGIAIGPDGGAYAKLQRWPAFNDVIVANNLVADYGAAHGAINLQNNPGQKSAFTNCKVMNNLIINSGGIGVDRRVEIATNVNTKLYGASGQFVAYTPLGTTNDFHRPAGAVVLQGTDLSAYFDLDKDGNPRPAGSRWTIGPYSNLSPRRAMDATAARASSVGREKATVAKDDRQKR